MRFFVPLVVAAGLALPLSAAAKPVLYDCAITKKSQKSNWIADKVLFVQDDNGGVRVVDRHLLHFTEGPATTRVRKKGDVLILSWLLTGIRGKSGANMPPAQYRADLDTKARKVTVYVSSSAFSGARLRGTGGCSVRSDGRLPKVLR